MNEIALTPYPPSTPTTPTGYLDTWGPLFGHLRNGIASDYAHAVSPPRAGDDQCGSAADALSPVGNICDVKVFYADDGRQQESWSDVQKAMDGGDRWHQCFQCQHYLLGSEEYQIRENILGRVIWEKSFGNIDLFQSVKNQKKMTCLGGIIRKLLRLSDRSRTILAMYSRVACHA